MSVRQLAQVDVTHVLAWINDVPFEWWPQQHRLADGKLRPAMVTDLAWGGFGTVTEPLIEPLLRHLPDPMAEAYGRMLSVVMPGHAIEPHRDEQPAGWLTRIHVPLVTNPKAVMVVGGVEHHMKVGAAYLVDTREEHSVRNDGETARVHFMFDVRT